jgi:hypothetical protein
LQNPLSWSCCQPADLWTLDSEGAPTMVLTFTAWASHGFWLKCITFLVYKKFTPVDPEFIIGRKTLRLLLQFGMQNLTPIKLEFIVWRMTLRLLLIQFGAQKIYTCWSVEFIYDLEETLSLLLQWQLCMTEKGHNNALEKKGGKSHTCHTSHTCLHVCMLWTFCALRFSVEKYIFWMAHPITRESQMKKWLPAVCHKCQLGT